MGNGIKKGGSTEGGYQAGCQLSGLQAMGVRLLLASTTKSASDVGWCVDRTHFREGAFRLVGRGDGITLWNWGRTAITHEVEGFWPGNKQIPQLTPPRGSRTIHSFCLITTSSLAYSNHRPAITYPPSVAIRPSTNATPFAGYSSNFAIFCSLALTRHVSLSSSSP
ncbi:unnamed protein product [Protopolystoma xenopodis]|uniref:Uncharacterized protein n=1 Tax=Protopolystoma xenopodis TaxID=117903 RepID=A0A448WZB7_9PLAT|nr:unnamed protein product [Protopolystoma xenopodis]